MSSAQISTEQGAVNLHDAVTISAPSDGVRAGSRVRAQGVFPIRPIEYALKRLIDLTAAVFGLIVLAPVILAIAAAVRIESKGPVFFRQRRLGRGGRVFWIWKVRTMVADAEDRQKDVESLNESSGGALFKLKCDPRVTRVGGFLRRTSLDEIPQFYNILLGDMSLVGPRPLPLRDCELLTRMDAAAASRRLEVLPGVTGPWQVNGRSKIGAARMVELDCHYVDNWSLAQDLVIIARTFKVLVLKDGAY